MDFGLSNFLARYNFPEKNVDFVVDSTVPFVVGKKEHDARSFKD